MIKIKLTFPYPEWPIARQLPAEIPVWGPYQFYINPETDADLHFDYWFVFNFPLNEFESGTCKRGSLVLITGEPESVDAFSSEYVSQFDYVITSQLGLKHKNKIFTPQGLPWFVNKSYDELIGIEAVHKPKKISLVTSDKLKTPGHRRRLDFAFRLKDYFGDELDLFGRGIHSFNDKWDVVAPYRYSIAIENNSHQFYFTEKIMDCFLSLTFPIYYGCTNIGDYFHKDSFLAIDINDFEGSVRNIENLISDPMHYTKSLPLLEAQKDKVLNEYNIFPLIARIAGSLNVTQEPFIQRRIDAPNRKTKLVRKLKNLIGL